MAEPAQATIKEAAEYFHYSERTVKRMIARRVLPSTGKGALLRIPWSAIHAKLARMQEEGEDLWHPHPGAKETKKAGAAPKVRAVSGQTGTVKRGTPTPTSTGSLADTVRVQSNKPRWS